MGGRIMMNASRLLLDQVEIQQALGSEASIEPARDHKAVHAVGHVVAAAAVDTAFRSLGGQVMVDEIARPVAVGQMALVFDHPAKSEHTFALVAEAAHLRTRLGECQVAVETVTATGGLVSYWGFLQLQASIVVLTLDTLDPQVVSMTNFRALVTQAAERLEGKRQ